MPSLAVILVVGAGVGFLGGLLGKGGSAIATPILVALGVPPMIAVAAPLPATVPGTLVAAHHYRRSGFVDRTVLWWSLGAGLPATVIGALLTRWISGAALVGITDVVIVGLGVRLLVRPDRDDAEGRTHLRSGPMPTVAVAVATGLAAGLLANSGGFLLAPLFITVLRLPVKRALGTSLAVAAVLAVPGTVVHAALGHLDWTVVVAFAFGSVPLAGVGARVALQTEPARLERVYGIALVVLGLLALVDLVR